MATVTGTQTEDEPENRMVVLRGVAKMVEGDDALLIDIPVPSQVPDGREISIKWEVKLTEEAIPVVTTLSWNALTQAQWNAMDQTQWNEMTQ